MSWEVQWTRPAVHDLRRLDHGTVLRIRAAVLRYAETAQGDVRRLTNVEPMTWRLRVGDYRVRFRFETEDDWETERILIQRVLHRREAYR